MKNKIPFILTDSYKVSHFILHDSEVVKEITDEDKQIIADLSERFQQEARRRMSFIHFTDEQIFANLEGNPGFGEEK